MRRRQSPLRIMHHDFPAGHSMIIGGCGRVGSGGCVGSGDDGNGSGDGIGGIGPGSDGPGTGAGSGKGYGVSLSAL